MKLSFEQGERVGAQDRYRIVRQLGHGGLGVVYEAEDRERGERVALKTLVRPGSEAVYELKREFRRLADLRHPNLVALHELVSDDDACFFTMELLQGRDFVAYCRGAPPSPDGREPTDPDPGDCVACDLDRLRGALRQLVLGVDALHRAGKLHRDIKPSNVLVNEDGRVVILDFGFAVDTEHAALESVAERIVGTAAYMAPEQARAIAPTPAVDWYGVGVLLYEALTGGRPFNGPAMTIMVDKQEREPTAPSSVVTGVPEDLDALCRDLLRRAPQERPDGRAIRARLGIVARGSRATVTPPIPRDAASSQLFAGRQQELEVLEQALTRARNGKLATVVIGGASGIGKSSLAREFVRRACEREPGILVLEGRCYWREAVRYKAMDRIIDALSHFWKLTPEAEAGALVPLDVTHLLRLFPVLERVPAVAAAPRVREVVDPQERRTRAFAAMRELFQRLAIRTPVIIFLDDAQWIDGDSVTLLADLLRGPDAPALLLVIARRSRPGTPRRPTTHGDDENEELSRLERSLAADSNLEKLELGALPRERTLELASRLLGDERGELAQRVADEADGSPLFAHELASFLRTASERISASVDLAGVIRARVDKLAPEARRILELLSVAGEPITRRSLRAASELAPNVLADHTRALVSARLARATGSRRDDTVEPYHDRIRQAVLADIADPTELHRALALAITSSKDGSAEQLARHWAGAAEPVRAARHAMKAADEAAETLDFERAAALARVALEEEGADLTDAERRTLLLRLANSLAHAGQPFNAATAYLAAAKLTPDDTVSDSDLALRRLAAELFLQGGYLEEGLSAARAVLRDVGMALPASTGRALAGIVWSHLRLGLRRMSWRPRSPRDVSPAELSKIDVCWSIGSGLAMVDTYLGALFTNRGALMSLHAGEPLRIARQLSAATMANAALGMVRRTERLLAATERAAEMDGSPRARHHAVVARYSKVFLLDCRYQEVLDGTTEAAKLWAESGRDRGFERDVNEQFACWSLMLLGRGLELRDRVSNLVREAERSGDRYLEVSFRTCFAITHLHDDAHEDGLRDVEDALASWLGDGGQFLNQHYWGLVSRTMIALYRGDVDAPGLDQAWSRMKGSLLSRVSFFRSEWFWTVGRLEVARAQQARARGNQAEERERLANARRWARRLDRVRLPLAPAFASMIRAGIAQMDGRDEEAIRQLQGALARLEELGCGVLTPPCHIRLGELLGGDEGERHRAAGAAWFEANRVARPDRVTAMVITGWPHPG